MRGDLSVLKHLVDSMSDAAMKLEEAQRNGDSAVAKNAVALILELHWKVKGELENA